MTAGRGPLLVLAGAGSGKTRVITYRIAHLIQGGSSPDRILGITFTNKAAREMKERLLRMYPDMKPVPWLSTFHSLGYRILKIEHERLGYRKNFPIYDDADSRGVLTEEMRSVVGMSEAEKNLEAARREISHWKARFVAPEQALEEADDDTTYLRARIYARYSDRLASLNAVDFDDLIYLPVRLVRDHEDVRDRWTSRFDCVLVDEYQDSNTAQYEFSRLLAGPDQNLTVVGDDDQSIYAFRGAEVEKILSFRRDFPRASVVTLEENYRSVGTILDAANAVIANNLRRHPKTMRSVRGAGSPIPYLTFEDEALEAEEVVNRVRAAKSRGLKFADQAILLRSAIQARPLEEKLRFYQVPYTIIGARSFFDRREVRDVIAYLRLLVLPEDDIAALRILNTPKRGWGAGSREKLDTFARESKIPILEALRRLEEIPGVSSAARSGADDLIGALDRASAKVEIDGPGALRDLLEEVRYDFAIREMATDSSDYDARKRSVQFILDIVGRHQERKGPGKLREFLTGLSLDSSRGETETHEDTLTLLTFHGAKGLEFRRVTLVGIDDDLIPHKKSVKEGGDKAIDEERRLFYVAITRAMDEILMTRAATRRQFGREVETIESRFVAEIPEELVVRKDVARADDTPVDQETRDDFMAQLRARFAKP
ncbi:MAG: UvrD-helicase domain-containing protein [Planctomycetes bacterium]|nr:UvrD-helicase domain-containing protein [Planctomycetota bacterium]